MKIPSINNCLTPEQICRHYGSALLFPAASDKLGIALSSLQKPPLNALRHAPENGACGWYVWGGSELPADDDFFQPLHASHLASYCPELVPYLGLAPGWRVLLVPGQTEVWFDASLLDV